MTDLTTAKRKYREQRTHAKSRCIDWQFTFEDWWAMWENSGKWYQRGRCKGQYVMSRKGDIGPYSPNNVDIKLHSENIIEAWTNSIKSVNTRAKMSTARKGKTQSTEHVAKRAAIRKGKTHSEETKAAMSVIRKDMPKVTCNHCSKVLDIPNAKRWHFNNCKRKTA
jgi:hypothetical protein